ncbi:uncharacterized protein F5147DRAFT_836962 [Suillus discolor]|uniref:Wings apart-like protein C-terminal domain-containing protein n=1 Tax=Suillus discolor TaxID=1912936 RepID=A0A9P7F8S4_9AGAM|nr:uncharacterized protein F5147DRAFT_836962 [Suillus discolor]KAG2108719.1 hypothetical protein F5147DRAFT_836962 [Suillus discolor]
MQRTYGRKNSRRARPNSPDVEAVLSPPRKRPRIKVEIVQPPSSAYLSPPKVTSPIRRSTTMPDVGSISSTPSRIRTPTKPARDLSTLFSASPHRTPNSPGKSLGVVKRMLSRSRTESSVDHNTGHNVCSLTPSSNTLPVHSSPPKIASSRSPSPTQNKPLLTKHTRTYAGASRSYRIALPAADLAEPDDTRESYADLRSRWGVDNSEDDPRPFDNDTGTPKRISSAGSRVLANGMMNDLKSITELRSKGESRRFLDEVGYLFESIESGCAIALRRASVLEIVTKLCDPEFNRRAKTSDFYARTWDVFLKARGDGPDKILDATLSFFAFLSTRDLQTLSELAHKPELVPTLLDILRSVTPTSDVKGDGLNQGLKKDILALALSGVDAMGLRASGIIRTDVAPLRALADVIVKSGVMKDIRRLSTRALLSTTLSSLPASLLPPALQTLPSILNSLRAELLLVPPRVSAWERGLELFPSYACSDIGLGKNGNTKRNGKGKETHKPSDPPIEIATPSLAHIHACLRLVDTYLLKEWMGHVPSRSGVASDGSRGTREQSEIYRALADPVLTDELVELCVATEILVRDCVRDLDTMNKEGDAEESQGELARKTLFSTFRILTLLPSSTSSHSRPSSTYSRSSPTYSDIHHDSWTPSDTALSLITRVVLRAQAGWVGSLCVDGVKGERDDEATQENEQYAVKPEELEDTDTSSPPLPGSRRESTRSPRKRTPLPVSSPSKLAHKPSITTNAPSKLGRQGMLHRNDMPSKGTSTPSAGNDTGKGKSKAISVPPYTLTRVESFDLLCLALGLLLNWASGGIEGGGVSEGMGRILLNRVCSATRSCSHICSCPPSSQVPLLSCLVSVYQAFGSSVFVSTDSSSRTQKIVSGHERKLAMGAGRKPPSARQQDSPSASPTCHSTSSRRKTASSLPTLNTSSMPQSPELTFLAGYTAVLLGLLCTPTAPHEIRVLSTNRSLIFGDVLIETLIKDVRDFLALYDDLEGELSDEGDIVDVDMSPDEDQGRSGGRGQGGGKGRGKALEKKSEDVARGVLRALEALRDDGL